MQFERDLSILLDDSATFKEFSRELQDYQRDEATFIIPVAGFLYVGLYKPFDALYFEGVTFNVNTSVMKGEFFNGTAFVSLDFFVDNSNGFSRSAFFNWNKSDNWAISDVNGDSLFWVRFSVNVATSSMTTRALNILFSDDTQLLAENSTILERFLPEGQVTFASLHQRTRDTIVQAIRNRGQFTKKGNDETQTGRGLINDVTKWDFLKIDQVREAAINLVLSNIYLQASDQPEDIWQVRHNHYKDKGNQHLQTFFLSLDRDDDGKEDESENRMTSAINVVRI